MENLRSTSPDGRKRAREGDESDRFDPIESADVKRRREDSDAEPVAQDHDLLMRSFQEEISTAPVPHAAEVVDLLGASDDDLGLPPRLRPDIIDDVRTREADLADAPHDSLWGLDVHVNGYDDGPGGFGGDASCGSYGYEGYEDVAFDSGLFEYMDVGSDPSDDLSC